MGQRIRRKKIERNQEEQDEELDKSKRRVYERNSIYANREYETKL